MFAIVVIILVVAFAIFEMRPSVLSHLEDTIGDIADMQTLL
jgi:hypothetical protein